MKNNILFLSILISVFLIKNCNRNQEYESKSISIQDKQYQEDRKSFLPYSSHFPESFSDFSFFYEIILTTEYENALSLFLADTIPDTDLVNLKNEFNEKAIATYDVNDSCLLIINRFSSIDNYREIVLSEEQKSMIDRECYRGKYPVPKFNFVSELIFPENYRVSINDLYDNENQLLLTKDFKIHVFKAKPGKYRKESLLTPYEFMPEYWAHGFSYGIAFDELKRVVIYWTCIW